MDFLEGGIWAFLFRVFFDDSLTFCGGVNDFASPVARLVFQGWQSILEESRGSEPEGLFHIVLYQNQIYMREKIKLSSMSQRPRVSSTKNFGRSLVSYKKSKNKKCQKFPGVAKRWHPVAQGWRLPPHATPWLRPVASWLVNWNHNQYCIHQNQRNPHGYQNFFQMT